MTSRGVSGRIVIGFILVAAVTHTGAQSGPPSSAMVAATAVMNAAMAGIGDRLAVNVTVERHAPSEARLHMTQPLGAFELVEVEHLAPRLPSGASIDEWRLTLVTFRPGRLTIPPIDIEIAFSDGRVVAVTTSPIEVTITAPEVTAATPLRPLATAPPLVPRSPWRRVLVLGVLVALMAWGIAVLAAHVLRRLDRRRQRVTYWRALARQIGRMTRAACDEWPRARAGYAQVSTLLRGGTARATALPVEHMSRRDLLRHVATDACVGADLPRHLQQTLSGLDAVRFAKHAPRDRMRDGVIRNVQKLLEAIRGVADRNRR